MQRKNNIYDSVKFNPIKIQKQKRKTEEKTKEKKSEE